MGIENFSGHFIGTYPEISIDIKNTLNIADYIYIDFNSIIHYVSINTQNKINFDIATSLYEKKRLNKKTTEEYNDIVVNDIIKYMKNKIINKTNKSKLKHIFISYDGIPEFAKCNEQQRRKKMNKFITLMRDKLLDLYKNDINEDYNSYMKNEYVFDKKLISADSPFIQNINDKLNVLLNNEIGNKYIISELNKYGEGEKKILHDIWLKRQIIQPDDNIIIISPDGDFIILAFTILYKFKSIDKQLKKLFIFDHNKDKMIDIVNLCNRIFNKYGINDEIKKYKFLRDMIFISTFYGNDYLPEIRSLNIKQDLMDIYLSCMGDKYIINQDQNLKCFINYNNLNIYINNLARHEDKTYNSILSKKINGQTNNDYINIDINEYEIMIFFTKNMYYLYNLYKILGDKLYKITDDSQTPNPNEIIKIIFKLYTVTNLKKQEDELKKEDELKEQIKKLNIKSCLTTYDTEYLFFINKKNIWQILFNDYGYYGDIQNYDTDIKNTEQIYKCTEYDPDITHKYIVGLDWMVNLYFNRIFEDVQEEKISTWNYGFNKAPFIIHIEKLLNLYSSNFTENLISQDKNISYDKYFSRNEYKNYVEPNVDEMQILMNDIYEKYIKYINYIKNIKNPLDKNEMINYINTYIQRLDNHLPCYKYHKQSDINCNGKKYLNKCDFLPHNTYKQDQDHKKEQNQRLQEERLQKERLQEERLQEERLQEERLQEERLQEERLQEERRLKQEKAEQLWREQAPIRELRRRRQQQQQIQEQERLIQERLIQERLLREQEETRISREQKLLQHDRERIQREQERLIQGRLIQERLIQEQGQNQTLPKYYLNLPPPPPPPAYNLIYGSNQQQNQRYPEPQQNQGRPNPVYNQRYPNQQQNQGRPNPVYNQRYPNPQQNQGRPNPVYNQRYPNQQQNQRYPNPQQNQRLPEPVQQQNQLYDYKWEYFNDQYPENMMGGDYYNKFMKYYHKNKK
jgi:hypothetical protein